jgi:hypothetical protein
MADKSSMCRDVLSLLELRLHQHKKRMRQMAAATKMTRPIPLAKLAHWSVTRLKPEELWWMFRSS